MEVFNHHLYEYEKGLRNLILYTAAPTELEYIEQRLNFRKVAFKIMTVSAERVNVFFGDSNAIRAVSHFVFKPLTELTDEEDFILGILLGYDRLKQCKRYLKRKNNVKTTVLLG